MNDLFDEEWNHDFRLNPPSGYDCDDQPCYDETGYLQLNGLPDTYFFSQAPGMYEAMTLGTFDVDVDALVNGSALVSSIVFAGLGPPFDPPLSNPFASLFSTAHANHEFSLRSVAFDAPDCAVTGNCQTVPEPESMTLMGLGFLFRSLACRLRRALGRRRFH